MGKLADDFNAYRSKMNDKILASDNKVMKRIYSLDTLTYQEGALSTKTKEMLGLQLQWFCVAMTVLNIILKNVLSRELQAMKSSRFLVLPTWLETIVIPHTRRAVEYWEELNTSTV